MADGLRAPAELQGLDSPGRGDGAQQHRHASPALPRLSLGARYLAPYANFHLPALDLTRVLRDTYHASQQEQQAAAREQQARISNHLQRHPGADPHDAPITHLAALATPEARQAVLTAALERRCRRTGIAFTPPHDLDGTGRDDSDGGGQRGDGGTHQMVYPTTPAGPPAAAILELPLHPATSAAPTSGPLPDAASAPLPPLLPSWLAASLGASLTHLDLSDSTLIDNRGWAGSGTLSSGAPAASGGAAAATGGAAGDGGGAGLDVLAALPRLQVLSLRSARLAAPLPGDLPARLPGLRVLDLAGACFCAPPAAVERMVLELAAGGAAAEGAEVVVAEGAEVVVAEGGSGVVGMAGAAGGRRRMAPLLLLGACSGHHEDELQVLCWAQAEPRISERAGGECSEAKDAEVKEQQQQQQQKEDEQGDVVVSSAAALCAVRASLERAFLHYAARGAWFELRQPSRSEYGYDSEDEEEDEDAREGGGGGDDDAWAARERQAERGRRARQRAEARRAAGGDGRVPCLGVEGLACDASLLLLVWELGLLPAAAAEVGEEDEEMSKAERAAAEGAGARQGQAGGGIGGGGGDGPPGEHMQELWRVRDVDGGARGTELGRHHLIMGR